MNKKELIIYLIVLLGVIPLLIYVLPWIWVGGVLILSKYVRLLWIAGLILIAVVIGIVLKIYHT